MNYNKQNNVDEAASLAFIDLEVDPKSNRILDIGGIDADGREFHGTVRHSLETFLTGKRFIGGHNILKHDLKYIKDTVNMAGVSFAIDTLPLSPLLFPSRPYHNLVKDDKLTSDAKNNPLNDAIKARNLFHDELAAWRSLNDNMKQIFASLLAGTEEFRGFFSYLNNTGNKGIAPEQTAELIKTSFSGNICENADVAAFVKEKPVELAYSLALISAREKTSLTPPWVQIQYPGVSLVMHELRAVPCKGCPYCDEKINIHKKLKTVFGYNSFRNYDGEPLQEEAVKTAVNGESLLCIFPTGGGKSLAFQLPALMAGELERGLTVVISPLQALMKDQVDTLEKKGLAEAATINGLLDPIERAKAIERTASGDISILYIAPESLRSAAVERLLLSRHISRFVIDEAHCFSSWGQDFRVDYLYIGEFIRNLQTRKMLSRPIPVSCFTATAKQKVISDIQDYFLKELSIEMKLIATKAARANLHYSVKFEETEEDKYNELRRLIESRNCPTIVYTSRTKKSEELAQRLARDGYTALAYHGQMERNERIANQNEFISNEVQIMVATAAFGMGVDKPDVGLVVHYDISDSLESYIQEAGRAGRDESIKAECVVLFNNEDLDKHFLLLNQSKLSISEIQQVWKAVRNLTKYRNKITVSALEIAREAGWDDNVYDLETKIRTAISALEKAGFLKRGQNSPRIYADSILCENMVKASEAIEKSSRFTSEQKKNAKRIMTRLYSSRSTQIAAGEDPESRVDYLADTLGLPIVDVVDIVNLLKEEEILGDTKDLNAYVVTNNRTKSAIGLHDYVALEEEIIRYLENSNVEEDALRHVNIKEINQQAAEKNIKSTVEALRRVFYYWTLTGKMGKTLEATSSYYPVRLKEKLSNIKKCADRRHEIAGFLAEWLTERQNELNDKTKPIEFSVKELVDAYNHPSQPSLIETTACSTHEVEDALLYLSKIGVISLEGGFLVIYNRMEITRCEQNNHRNYRKSDYSDLDEYYKMKIQQIHIVGEYARILRSNYQEASEFVNDYFHMDYQQFIKKYFKGNKEEELRRNITTEKYQKLFCTLSERQREIIDDSVSPVIVVAAGPGSGKTKVLVHKLASLVQLEDVRYEQLLMLTFSRSAASEFKERLGDLIGHAAYFVRDIKTFHSYAFDLLGLKGNMEELNRDDIIKRAAELVDSGEAPHVNITKTVLVIDEAQDIAADDYALISALMKKNENMRVIAVGDDDQNIFTFRGSDSLYLKKLMSCPDAKFYELTENYRSARMIIDFINIWAGMIPNRLKRTQITAVRSELGSVRIIHHNSRNMLQAVADDVTANLQGSSSAAILTVTNEDAARIAALLEGNRAGIRTELIGEDTMLNMQQIAEIRCVMKYLNEHTDAADGSLIDKETLKQALAELDRVFERSTFRPHAHQLFRRFFGREFQAAFSEKSELDKEESASGGVQSPKVYMSDLELFLRESKLEDAYEPNEKKVFISTIHKAKGREFSKVFVLLKENWALKDEDKKRAAYVAFSRAKDELNVHYCDNTFNALCPELRKREIAFCRDTKKYDDPKRIMLQLGFTDVFLDVFYDENIEKSVRLCRSGDDLAADLKGMCRVSRGDNSSRNISSRYVLKYSKKFKDKLAKWQTRGYELAKAKVRLIVFWKAEDKDREVPIILPDLYLEKKRI